MQELTWGRKRSSAGSGRLLRRRIDGGDLRAPEVKTMMLRSISASSDRVRRWVAPRGQGGARVRREGAREWLWLRWLRTAAAEAFGCARGRGEGETKGTSEGVQGFEAAPKRRPEASRWRGTQAGREVACRHGARVRCLPPLPTGRGRGRLAPGQWAGLSTGPAR